MAPMNAMPKHKPARVLAGRRHGGGILNLAIWFARHVIFAELRPGTRFGTSLDPPVLSSLDAAVALLTLAAALGALAAFRLRIGMLTVLAGSAATGAASRLAARAGGIQPARRRVAGRGRPG